MRFAFVMDPLEVINPKADTTFALMRAAVARGHRVAFVPAEGLAWQADHIVLRGQWVVPDATQQPVPFTVQESCCSADEEWDAIFIRLDPPFDARYLMVTWLLSHAAHKVPVINAPAGLRTVNEKVWVAQFSGLTPPTLITSDMQAYEAFLREQGVVVLKPTDGYGGQSVFRMAAADSNRRVAFETLSHYGQRPVVVQGYIAQAEAGDKRILLLDGEPLGVLLRVHAAEDHRNNLATGGRVEPARLSPSDEGIVATLKPHLQRLGLVFVGLDILGDKLIEVNVTSPTCLQELSHFAGRDLAEAVMAWVEQHAARLMGR
jgi:glutathione synthase